MKTSIMSARHGRLTADALPLSDTPLTNYCRLNETGTHESINQFTYLNT